jgi:hypothetical protein
LLLFGLLTLGLSLALFISLPFSLPCRPYKFGSSNPATAPATATEAIAPTGPAEV